MHELKSLGKSTAPREPPLGLCRGSEPLTVMPDSLELHCKDRRLVVKVFGKKLSILDACLYMALCSIVASDSPSS